MQDRPGSAECEKGLSSGLCFFVVLSIFFLQEEENNSSLAGRNRTVVMFECVAFKQLICLCSD